MPTGRVDPYAYLHVQSHQPSEKKAIKREHEALPNFTTHDDPAVVYTT